MRNKKITFKKSNNINEAEKYAKKMGVRAYYKGLDLEIANICNQCLVDAFNKFPEIRKTINVIGNGKTINKELKNTLLSAIKKSLYIETELSADEINTNAEIIIKKYIRRMDSAARVMIYPSEKAHSKIEKILAKYTGIYIDSQIINNHDAINKEYNEYIKTGYSPKGLENKGVKAIIDHELGHMIDWCYEAFQNPDIAEIFKSSDVKSEVSEYAEENIHEFFAECWTEYINSNQPRKVSESVIVAFQKTC